MKLEKKRYYAVILTLLAVTVILGLVALTYDVRSKREITVNKVTMTDNLNYYVYLKPNYLFENKTVLKNSMIYANITKSIYVEYSFSANSLRGSVGGEYEVIAEITTREWSKKITLIPKRKFVNTYFIRFPIDMELFRDVYDRINHELGFRGTDPNVKIIIITDVKAENYTGQYTHDLTFPLLSKAFRISTKHNTYDVKRIRKTITVIDEVKYKTRMAIGILSLITLVSIPIFCWRVKPIEIKKDEATIAYERYKDFIAIGKIENPNFAIVKLESFEELLKIAEILNKPIIKDGKKFGVIDGQTLYLYEFTTSYSPT